jgi:hypothetical protein
MTKISERVAKPTPEHKSVDGLRFRSKPTGSPFGAISDFASLSCILCGKHKPRSLGRHANLGGRSQFVCFDCRPPAQAQTPH